MPCYELAMQDTDENNADWTEVARSKGHSVRSLMILTGLSHEAVRQCLVHRRLPRNPVVAKAFGEALGMEVNALTGHLVATVVKEGEQ